VCTTTASLPLATDSNWSSHFGAGHQACRLSETIWCSNNTVSDLVAVQQVAWRSRLVQRKGKVIVHDQFVEAVAILENGCNKILHTMTGAVNLCNKVV